MNALEIAKYVINYALENDAPISNLQLQKILYFLVRDFYKKTSRFLFVEDFIAYPLGPVVQEVYEVYRGYGSSKIFDKTSPEAKLDEETKSTVDSILNRYIRETAFNLVNLSHCKGGAWQQTIDHKGPYRVIDKELIKKDDCK